MKSCKQATRRRKAITRRKRRKVTTRKRRKARKLISRGGQGGHDFEEAPHYHLNIKKPSGHMGEMTYPLYKNEIRSNDNIVIFHPAATVGSIREYIKDSYDDIKEPFEIEWLGNLQDDRIGNGIPLPDDTTLLSSLRLSDDPDPLKDGHLPLFHRGNPVHRTFKIVPST